MKSAEYWIIQASFQRSKMDFWELAIPDLLEHGAQDFMKIPTMNGLVDGKPIPTDGYRRPLGCPEPSPDGSQFALTWFDGVEWNIAIRSTLSALQEPDDYTRESSMDLLRGDEWKGDSLASLTLSLEQRIVFNKRFRPSETLPPWPSQSHRKKIEDPIDMDDIEKIFEAGVAFGRMQASLQTRSLNPVTNNERDWAEIIRHSALRHGHNLSATELAEKMGGELFDRDVKDPNDPQGSRVRHRGIKWPDTSETELVTFSEAHRRWRNKNPLKKMICQEKSISRPR